MTSEHRWQRGQKRPHSPGFDEGFIHHPTHTVFQNAEPGQHTQGVEKSRGYSLSQFSMGSHRNPANKAPGEFNDHDDHLIRTAVASGAPFPLLKEFLFPDRADISSKSLESRAHKIDACWGKEEDEWLSCLIVKGNESDPEFVADLQSNWLPWRDVKTLEVRITHLKNAKRGGETSHNEQPQDYTTQGTHFELPVHRGDAPNYSDTEPPALFPGSVNQNFEYPGAGSAQTDPNDQQYYHHNVQENASGYPEDGLDYLDVDPFLSSPGEPNSGSVDPDTISAAGIWNDYSNHPMEPGAYQDMDMSIEALFQGQKYSNHGIQPSFAGHTIATSNYPSTGPSPIRSVVATQSLIDISTSPAPSYDSVRKTHQPTSPNEPRTPEHGRSYASREESAEAADNTGKLTEEIIPEVQRRLAEGWEWREVNAVYFPGSNYFTMIDFLKRRHCNLWKQGQDRHLRILRRNGYDWAQICENLVGPRRTEDEVKTRFERLRRDTR